jgi:DNA-binding NtrC family response regulator
MNAAILVVDDDPTLRRALGDRLRSWGHTTVTAANGNDALEAARGREFDLVLLDLSMPGIPGIDVLRRLKEEEYPAEIVVLTSHGSIESAVDAIKLGATNFLTKPADFEIIRNVVQRSIEHRRLSRWNRAGAAYQTDAAEGFVLGRSAAMQQVLDLAVRAAPSNATVLITGESGCGKQVLAEFIHRRSDRREAPFLHVNCVAIADLLIESTLFGHEKGAFTGADSRKEGRLEAAAGGTAFLDEIGDVSQAFQAKLLHFLDKGEFERVGGTRILSVDCRVIAATNRDLKVAIREGRFREDLFHRLNVIHLLLPPLRNRSEDIPQLAQALLERSRGRFGCGPLQFESRTLDLLQRYSWPGNIRQLENAVDRMVVLARSGTLTPDLLPPEIVGDRALSQQAAAEELSLKGAMRQFKREYIVAMLARTGGNQTRAAQLLGIQRTFLSRLMKELEI